MRISIRRRRGIYAVVSTEVVQGRVNWSVWTILSNVWSGRPIRWTRSILSRVFSFWLIIPSRRFIRRLRSARFIGLSIFRVLRSLGSLMLRCLMLLLLPLLMLYHCMMLLHVPNSHHMLLLQPMLIPGVAWMHEA